MIYGLCTHGGGQSGSKSARVPDHFTLAKLTSHPGNLQYRRATARQAKEIASEDCRAGASLRRRTFPVKYVYILQSEQDAEHFYTGITDDLDARHLKHNSGEVAHTAKYRPWHIKSYVAFTDDTRAFAFEKYPDCAFFGQLNRPEPGTPAYLAVNAALPSCKIWKLRQPLPFYR